MEFDQSEESVQLDKSIVSVGIRMQSSMLQCNVVSRFNVCQRAPKNGVLDNPTAVTDRVQRHSGDK